jgi:dTDP-4-dehydrorhamnose 3,5-epimerase
MKLIETQLEGLVVLEPKVFGDQRGYFFESFNKKTFNMLNLTHEFVQDNESRSSYGTLRGLHFQLNEHAQTKLVRVVEGAVLDVALDLRSGSKTFGKHFSCELTSENKKIMLIPRGFAHGFVVLSRTAVFHYKCDNYYSPAHESGVLWSDHDLNINWRLPAKDITLSEKDAKLGRFKGLKLHE